jgi:hypothetical protein
MAAAARTQIASDQPPGRTIGLWLSLLTVFIFFGLAPLVPPLFIGILHLEGHNFTPSDGSFWVPPLVGLLTMVTCVFAWFGRPRRSRELFLAMATLAAVVNLYAAARPVILMSSGSGFGGGSFDSTLQGLGNCLIPLRILTLLYALWYVNRAPARAFYAARTR